MPLDDRESFSEIMFLLLGGTGVGYSVQKHHVAKLPPINKPYPKRKKRFLIGDSIEGWADAIKVLMKSYLNGKSSRVEFDYSDIRPKGARLITSGGKAPGPQPLKECIVKITGILDQKEDGEQLNTLEVHDIVCYIADAVLAGGIRRAALISLFSADDNDMIACKSGNWWELNPQRGRANNSAVLMRHKITKEFFMKLWDRVEKSGAGEPGIYFNNDKDWGTNPCCEIALRPFQFCNLCEVNVSDIEDQNDFNNRVKAAALIGTLQAGYTYGWEDCVDGSDEAEAVPTVATDCAPPPPPPCDTVYVDSPVYIYETIFQTDTLYQTEYITQILFDTIVEIEYETIFEEIFVTDTLYMEGALDTLFIDVIEYVDVFVFDTIVEIETEYIEFFTTDTIIEYVEIIKTLLVII